MTIRIWLVDEHRVVRQGGVVGGEGAGQDEGGQGGDGEEGAAGPGHRRHPCARQARAGAARPSAAACAQRPVR